VAKIGCKRRLVLSAALGCVLAAAAAGQAAWRSFHSPSGNIVCRYSWRGAFLQCGRLNDGFSYGLLVGMGSGLQPRGTVYGFPRGHVLSYGAIWRYPDRGGRGKDPM
jgi:hypothetical protein